MDLPSKRDISPESENLDGQWAVRHFLGKSIEEAEALFRERAPHYLEDLMHMGPVAFRFYFPAADRYVRSNHARGDSSTVSHLADILELRIRYEELELAPIAESLGKFCSDVAASIDRFDVSSEIAGDLRGRYLRLASQFQAIQGMR
jgi:hypothetical protein